MFKFKIKTNIFSKTWKYYFEFANNLDPNKDQQNMDPNSLTPRLGIWANFWMESIIIWQFWKKENNI